jgi:hypothetical protein
LHEEIASDDDLYRREISYQVNPDGKVNSAAFKLKHPKRADPSISVYWSRLISPEECRDLANIPGVGVASLKARVPRSMGFTVRRDIQPDDHPAHSLIEGASTMEHCSLLAEACVLIIQPTRRGSAGV